MHRNKASTEGDLTAHSGDNDVGNVPPKMLARTAETYHLMNL